MTEQIIPGCHHYNSLTGVCEIMFVNRPGAPKPTLAEEALIDPPGVLAGRTILKVTGLMCTAANEPESQKTCSHFETRTEADNSRDENV